jgi:formate dehydrogenase maturation protein FdhE
MSCGVFDDYPTTERKKCNNCRSSEDVDYTNISSSNIKDMVMGTKGH